MMTSGGHSGQQRLAFQFRQFRVWHLYARQVVRQIGGPIHQPIGGYGLHLAFQHRSCPGFEGREPDVGFQTGMHLINIGDLDMGFTTSCSPCGTMSRIGVPGEITSPDVCTPSP